MRCVKLLKAAGAFECILIVGTESVCSVCWQTYGPLVPLSKRYWISMRW